MSSSGTGSIEIGHRLSERRKRNKGNTIMFWDKSMTWAFDCVSLKSAYKSQQPISIEILFLEEK